MAARSKRLCGPVVLTVAPQLVYTCPLGRTALVKKIRLVMQEDDAAFFDLCVGSHDFEHALYWQSSIPKRAIVVDDEGVVLGQGEELHAAISVDGAGVLWISGAELMA